MPTTSPSHSTPEAPKDALASLRINRDVESSGRSGKRWWKVLLILLILSSGGWFGYRHAVNSGLLGESSKWVPEIMQNRAEVELTSITVQKGRSADAVVVATGYLKSRRQARIGAQAAGRINVIRFEEGDRVKVGEVLAELDHKDLDASLAAAVASVARAKAAIGEQQITIEQALVAQQRAEKLWPQRGVSESEYDQAKFTYRAAVARLRALEAEIGLVEAQRQQAEQLKENMFIRAPFDGTVISKDAEVGESILPGGMGGGSGRGSVATIADLDNLEIECDVQEGFISRVNENQEADVAVDAVPDRKYHGHVRKILPMGDRARATIKVQVEISDADELLFPEMSGTVFFLPAEGQQEVSEEPRYFCPASSVQTEGDAQFVWIIDGEQRAQKLVVKTGEERNGRIEIVEGVSGKERVVVNPQALQVGTPVKISE